jgi:hypothetical protein
MKVISPSDIDGANLIPHIKVRNNKNDPFSKHKEVQHKKYIINEDQISAKKDFLIVEVDSKKDLHCTMIYCKKIGAKVDLFDCFKKIIKVLNTYPELIIQYAELPYFGQECINFWHNDAPENYPFNVKLPDGYTTKSDTVPNYDNIKTTLGGSILQ